MVRQPDCPLCLPRSRDKLAGTGSAGEYKLTPDQLREQAANAAEASFLPHQKLALLFTHRAQLMRFSILHLSDLHRDLEDEIDNEWLLLSLERDMQQFGSQTPQILTPAVCIVSGDLIYGAGPSHADPANEVVRQYKQAEEFLVGLADRFFGGDRESEL